FQPSTISIKLTPLGRFYWRVKIHLAVKPVGSNGSPLLTFKIEKAQMVNRPIIGEDLQLLSSIQIFLRVGTRILVYAIANPASL
ncbi:hypothetical protein, partial [Spirulina sp. 06S082]|uniref:hypothetical protein n=1 Tax=Spirulina sp. 06S082 TaxID=3110248 RepID=UPI002B209999